MSTTTKNASGFQTSAAGSQFVGLKVAGVSINVTPAPNTRVDLVGFGHVILNEQIATNKTNSASLTVNMIHVFITQQNALGIPIGTNIIVSHAFSSLRGQVFGTLDGFAYGTKANVANTLISGKSALVLMPCLGTFGIIKHNEIAQVQVPGLFLVGEVRSTAQGTVNATTAMGETTNTTQNANILSNLVTATVIKADANAKKNANGTFTFSDSGSGFATLSVQGFPNINANVAPNTKLTIPGVGTLFLHRVIRTPNSIEVRMIELILNQPVNGFAKGTTVQVAVAHASAH
ncbi:MAG: hypothetical protein H0W34_08545 [Pyrinomonadaceae bacterium]|nr:hypothetical protein [Pyrinomonadaceae bacterium]